MIWQVMLPRTAEYALRTVTWLARTAGQAQSAEHLAEHTLVPRRYLHRVLQSLVRAGLVHSRSGPGGGYALTRSPEDITILDVVNALAPLERIRRCPLGIASHTQLCPLHRELDRAYEATEDAFAQVTIAQLADSSSNVSPLCEIESVVPSSIT